MHQHSLSLVSLFHIHSSPMLNFLHTPHMPCHTQTNEWVLLLEGACRIRIDSVKGSSGDQHSFTAHVTQLEPIVPPLSQQQSQQQSQQGSNIKAAEAESSAEVQELGKQLRSTTKDLLKKLM